MTKTNKNKSVASKSNKNKSVATTEQATENKSVAQSTITIQTSQATEQSKSDDVKQYASSNASSKRITIFNKSLTSVVKAFCLQLDLSVQDALAVTSRLASRNDYAKASVTTAMSDAKNDKYRKHVAILSDDEVKQVRKTLETIAKEQKATASK